MGHQRNSSEKIRHKKKLLIARENHILDAAFELCLNHGIENVTVSKIAHRAGIGKGTIYKHFVTKNEIFIQIILNYERNLHDQLLISGKNPKASPNENSIRIYLNKRLANPSKDYLIQKLELFLVNAEGISVYLEELFRIRKAISEILEKSIKYSTKNDAFDNMPGEYHYLACQTLVQTAIEIYSNDSLKCRPDIQDLMDLVAEIGKTIANK